MPLGLNSIESQERGPEDHEGEQHRIPSTRRLLWVGCAAPRRANRGAANDQSSHRSSYSERQVDRQGQVSKPSMPL